MLDYNQIRERKYIELDNTVYEVISSQVSRKQARKPVNQTKLKNLITGGVTERSFSNSEKVNEADISREKYIFLFKKDNRQSREVEYWFSPSENLKERFMVAESILGDSIKFMKERSEVEAIIWTDRDDEDSVIGVKLPIKVELEVTEAPPNIKGNTVSGGDKKVVLETGLVVSTPLFIETGDILRINTETSEYVERA
jgi:elongation factor P